MQLMFPNDTFRLRVRSTLQLYTGLHALTQLHDADAAALMWLLPLLHIFLFVIRLPLRTPAKMDEFSEKL